ncbi:hypothetical protein RIF29_29803 [Crotalaria pallida]|uniref:mitogen-activated protein kinase kinase n=1 Tax=Crotalaria pallida TaxID=3830 RepID=A0AAN9I0Q8_CROPI
MKESSSSLADSSARKKKLPYDNLLKIKVSVLCVQPPTIKPTDDQLSLADIDIVKVVGKGNEGLVQLVQHKWTNQFFALKIIQMNIEEFVRKQIAKELKINQAAQCPYVVVFCQSFYDNGVISIILEYMDGGSLADLMKKVKTIPEPYLAAIWMIRMLQVTHLQTLSLTL